MRIKNLLEKRVRIILDNGRTLELQVDVKKGPRVTSKSVKLPNRLELAANWEIPLFYTRDGKVEDLPEQEDDVVLLTSKEVARACRRNDVCHLGDPILKKKKIIGYNGLVFPVITAGLGAPCLA